MASKLAQNTNIVVTRVKKTKIKAYSHVSADMGVLIVPNIGQILPYVGANFYMRPVNRRVPLGDQRRLARQISFTVGVTAGGMKSDDLQVYRREDLFSSHSVLFGGGYRAVKNLRIGIGGMLYREGSIINRDRNMNQDPRFDMGYPPKLLHFLVLRLERYRCFRKIGFPHWYLVIVRDSVLMEFC